MKVIKTILGFLGLALTYTVAVPLFMNMDAGDKFLAERGYSVNPQFTGGDVIQTIKRDMYSVQIHQFVPDRFFLDLKTGFIQVDFLFEQGNIAKISETLNITGDGVDDLKVDLDAIEPSASVVCYNDQIPGLLARDYLSTYIRIARQDTDDALYVYDSGISIRARVNGGK